MIRNKTRFLEELQKTNPWWLGKEIPELKKKLIKREKFDEALEEIKGRRVVIVTGPRRSGKTIFLKQHIDHLLRRGTPERNILFYSMDDPSLQIYSTQMLKDLLDYFLEEISQKGRKYLFLDEVHLYEGWYRWVKSYYDKYPDLKFVLSGSSSLKLQRKANRYLRGRMITLELLPFSFKEFLRMSGKHLQIKDLKELFELDELEVRKMIDRIEPEFELFLRVGGFPEWFEVKDEARWFRMMIEDVPKKAIYEDVADLFGIRNPRVLELVLDFLAANQSRILSYESINEVAGLDRNTLVKYLDYLNSTYLILEILKHVRNIKTQLKAKRKYLLIDQGLRNSLLKEYEIKEDNIGFVLENLVGVHLFKTGIRDIFYYKDDEVDFVFRSRSKGFVALEVKYRKDIREKDIQGIKKLLGREEIKYGIIVTKDRFEKRSLEGKELFFVPAPIFCLLDSFNLGI